MYAVCAALQSDIRPVVDDQRYAVAVGDIFEFLRRTQQLAVSQCLLSQLNHGGSSQDRLFHSLGQRSVFQPASVRDSIEPDVFRIDFHDISFLLLFCVSDMSVLLLSDCFRLPAGNRKRFGPPYKTG